MPKSSASTAKLEKLLEIRKRLTHALGHYVKEVNKLTKDTSKSIVLLRDRSLEKLWYDFTSNVEALDGCKFDVSEKLYIQKEHAL